MKRILAAALGLLAVLAAGCGRDGDTDGGAFAPPEEQRLVIYTSHKQEVYEPLVREFEQRSGIWVELKTGGTTELLELIARGDTDCDLMLGGGADSLSAYASCFSPYRSIHEENIAPEYRSADGSYSPFSTLPVVLIYNTKLVRMNPPTGWESLLDSAWRGKIAFADPEVSGSSYTGLCTLLQALPGDREENLKKFAYNLKGRQLSSSGEVVSAVAEGSCYIGVTLEETALKGMDSGYDIAIIYPEEGTSALPDGAAVVAGCAHEDNARLFIDFMLSPEVQQLLPEKFSRRSVYGTDESLESIELIDYELQWASSRQKAILELWGELFEGAQE